MKKIIFLMHNGGRLGNQLWVLFAFYAYCLEKKLELDVRCFWEYQRYFNVPIHSLFSRILGSLYHTSALRDMFILIFTTWVEIFAMIMDKKILYDSDQATQNTFRIFLYKKYKTVARMMRKEEFPVLNAGLHVSPLILLPPSSENDPLLSKPYAYGWLFRNPVGIIRYRDEIVRFFTPKDEIVEKINLIIKGARKNFQHIVGVHIRLGDCINEAIDSDPVAYSESEVNSILNGYVDFFGLDRTATCFFICSDGTISPEAFPGLSIVVTKQNAVEDLWLLSQTDSIIGADSSFAISASYLGNKPFMVFRRNGMDFEYYKDKTSFFINKYVRRFIY